MKGRQHRLHRRQTHGTADVATSTPAYLSHYQLAL